MPLRAVVTGIAGTASATAFVAGRLYPYAAERFAEWVDGHAADPDVAGAVRQARALIGDPAADSGTVVTALKRWAAADEQVTAVKTLQGKIWAHGFTSGDLVSHFYPDVIPALRRWHAAGQRLYVFSCGSVAGQRGWFGHSPEGNLLPLMSGFFDTENAGPKREAGSYTRIAGEIRAGSGSGNGPEPAETVYLSGVTAELDAAGQAGWHPVAVRRPGEPHSGEPAAGHLVIASFDQLNLSGDRPAVSGSPKPGRPPPGSAARPARPPPGRPGASR